MSAMRDAHYNAIEDETPTEQSALLADGLSRDSSSQVSETTLQDVAPDHAKGAYEPQKISRGRAFLIALGLWGLLFLQASNMSGLTTTQGQIASDLDAFESTTWFTSAYLIAMSSTSPLAARLASIFSPKTCLFASSLLFGLGGLVTSQASSLSCFLLGRVVTGLGGSGIISISFILVLELTSPKRRGVFIGLLNTGFTTGVSFGAVIFGALLNRTGWRFLFWIQAPLALAFGVNIYLSIPGEVTTKSQDEVSILSKLYRIDYAGAATLATSTSLFLFGVSSTRILPVPIVVSLCTLCTFVYVEMYHAKEPIIPATLLSSRGALLSCVSQLGLMAARWSVLFYTPAYAIAVRAWSPASAGAILIPTNLGFAIGGILVGWLHIKRSGSFYTASIVTYCCFATTLFVLSQSLSPKFPVPLFMAIVFANGFCTGAALNYTLAHLLHLIPPSNHYVGTALLTTFRGFAGSFGSAAGGGLFTRTLRLSLEQHFKQNGGLKGREELIRKLVGSPITVQALEGDDRKIAIHSYVIALRTLFLSGIVLAIAMTLIQAATGWKKGSETESSHAHGVAENDQLEEGMERAG